jgi:hypothetical protein
LLCMKLFIRWIEAMHCDDTTKEEDQPGKPQMMSVVMKRRITQYSHLQGRRGHRGSPSMEEESRHDRGPQSKRSMTGISFGKD